MSHKATMWAVTVRGISCAEARVLWHLSDCHNPVEGCFPSQEYLAEACEIDERSVRRHLWSLRAKGLINWTEQRDGKYRKNNRYALGFEAGFRAAEPEDQPDNLSGSNSHAATGQNEPFEPDNSDVLNRTLESSKEKPVIEPVREPERESAGASSEEDPKKIERKFKAWYPTWPSYLSSSEDAARKAFFSLTHEERADCIAKTPAFVAAVKASKSPKFTYAAVYLAEKAWTRLEDPKDEIGPATLHAPFSRPWMAMLLGEVSKPMATAWPAMTIFQRQKASKSAEDAREVDMERRAKYGWPKAAWMLSEHKPLTVPALLVGISEDFAGVSPDSDIAARWQDLFQRKGWPWPTSGFNYLHLPAGEPEQAMAEFQRRLSEGKGNDDAA